MRKHPISCFVIVRDEADRLAKCLAPLAGWVDELIVLDSGSTDGSVDIAQRFATRTYQTDWPGFGAQRNRALGYCQHDWILNIDADEIMSEALKAEIDDVLSEDPLDYTLIAIPWNTLLLGKPLRHGRYAAPQGKLFHRRGARFKERSVHESLELETVRKKTLRSPLLHDSWRDYQHLQRKHLDYAMLSAADKFAAGKRSSLAFAILRLFTDFVHQYVFRLGFLDGWRGLLMAVVLGQYAFHKYAALVALQTRARLDDTKDGRAHP